MDAEVGAAGIDVSAAYRQAVAAARSLDRQEAVSAVNAVIKRSANLACPVQDNGQIAFDVDAGIGTAVVAGALGDRRVTQRQSVAPGVVNRRALAARYGVVTRFEDVPAVHPQAVDLRLAFVAGQQTAKRIFYCLSDQRVAVGVGVDVGVEIEFE